MVSHFKEEMPPQGGTPRPQIPVGIQPTSCCGLHQMTNQATGGPEHLPWACRLPAPASGRQWESSKHALTHPLEL